MNLAFVYIILASLYALCLTIIAKVLCLFSIPFNSILDRISVAFVGLKICDNTWLYDPMGFIDR